MSLTSLGTDLLQVGFARLNCLPPPSIKLSARVYSENSFLINRHHFYFSCLCIMIKLPSYFWFSFIYLTETIFWFILLSNQHIHDFFFDLDVWINIKNVGVEFLDFWQISVLRLRMRMTKCLFNNLIWHSIWHDFSILLVWLFKVA